MFNHHSMNNYTSFTPENSKMVLRTMMGSPCVLILDSWGREHLLDFDISPESLADWSRLYALGALTPGDCVSPWAV